MKIYKKISISLIILSIFFFPVFIYAQTELTTPTVIKIEIPNPTTAGSDLPSLLTAILNNVVMPIAAVAVVMWIIWAGFTYLTANGNPKKIQEAHQRLLWALIGAGILLGAAGISAVVQNTIGALIK